MAEDAYAGPSDEDGGGLDDTQGEITRRGLLAAGGVTAAGVLTIGIAVPAEGSAGAGSRIGSGLTDRESVRLVGQIDQNGTVLTGYGYLTKVRALANSDLYTRAPAKTSNDPRSADSSAARFTFASRADIESMSAVGDVLSAVARGSVHIYYQAQGGARFADPASFAKGKEIAHLTGELQNDLSVDGPNQGSVAISGDLTQQAAPRFTIGSRQHMFGRPRLPWSIRAAGRAHRTEPTAPRATLSISGSLGAIDARQS